jgi:hypothetical protein
LASDFHIDIVKAIRPGLRAKSMQPYALQLGNCEAFPWQARQKTFIVN